MSKQKQFRNKELVGGIDALGGFEEIVSEEAFEPYEQAEARAASRVTNLQSLPGAVWVSPDAPQIGGVLDIVSDTASDVGDWVKGAASDVADYASDPSNWLRAISYMGWTGMLTSFLPGVLGMVADATVVAMPGLVRGESFSDALVAEYGLRLKRVAEAYGPQLAKEVNGQVDTLVKNAALREEVQGSLARVRAMDPSLNLSAALKRAGCDPETLAQKLHVRPDVAAMVLNVFLHRKVYEPSDFDLQTGARAAIRSLVDVQHRAPSTPVTTSAEAYKRWQDSSRAGHPAVVLAALEAKYNQLRAHEELLKAQGIRTGLPVDMSKLVATPAEAMPMAASLPTGMIRPSEEDPGSVFPLIVIGGITASAVGLLLWKFRRAAL